MIKPITELYLMTQDELFNYVQSEVKKHASNFKDIQISRGNYIAAIPNEPSPFLVAHVDIVGNVPPARIQIERLDPHVRSYNRQSSKIQNLKSDMRFALSHLGYMGDQDFRYAYKLGQEERNPTSIGKILNKHKRTSQLKK